MSKFRPVILLGGGGHGAVVFDALRLLNMNVLGVCDPGLPVGQHERFGVPVLGDDKKVLEHGPEDLFVANGVGSVGSTRTRRRVFERFHAAGYDFATLIHPSAVVAEDVSVGNGAQIMARAVVQTGSIIGVNALVNTSASIDHDCRIGDHVHIAPGGVLSGGVTVEEGAHVGTGARIKQGVTIGRNALVGIGVTVLVDVPANSRIHPAETPVWAG